jgi:DNA-binding NarL/FixJ family response regulator
MAAPRQTPTGCPGPAACRAAHVPVPRRAALGRPAHTELTATGASAPQSAAPDVLAALTPQELQIARLAGRGLPNRDIAAHLFLSPRTVAYHLYKAYPKLGIASRAELTALV